MRARTLDRVKLGMSPHTGEVFIYSHGVNPGIPLFKRPALNELVTCFVGVMMFGTENGGARNVQIGSKWYQVAAIPIEDPTPKPIEGVVPVVAISEGAPNAEDA